MNIMTLAMDSIEFRFQGTASHAAAYPEKGVNALDAVNLMFGRNQCNAPADKK